GIALLFLSAFVCKLRDMAQFRQAITNFRLLPASMSAVVALFFVICELGITISMLIGGVFLLPGFLVAVLLLLIFSGALAVVLSRKQHTRCNCFGVSNSPITVVD